MPPFGSCRQSKRVRGKLDRFRPEIWLIQDEALAQGEIDESSTENRNARRGHNRCSWRRACPGRS